MRNYQPKRNNPYQLPHNVYMQCLYAVRDYDRLKKEMQDVIHSSPTHDGQPRGTYTSDSTGNKAVRLEALSRCCEAIEQALMQIPAEYRKGVMNNILHQCDYPADAGEATYKRWRLRFIYYVAENKKML